MPRPRLFIAVLLLALTALAGTAQADQTRLFVNLTSDAAPRAGMALQLSQNVLKAGHPVTVFLNVEGVRIAAKGLPQAKNEITGKTLQAMLQEVIAAGGQVIVCPMCMQQYGVKPADLVEGAVVGKPDITFPALLDDDTQVISY